jgi:hypothetical protein
MGEAADLIIEGVLCQQCGGTIDGDAPGHPRNCSNCSGRRRRKRDKPKKRREQYRGRRGGRSDDE